MRENTRRRSSRNSKQNVENTPTHTGEKNLGRSRSSSNKNSSQKKTIQSRNSLESTQTVPDTENSPQRKRKRSISSTSTERHKISKRVDGRIIDVYCWVCHKFGSDSFCNSCPRVYHKNCLKKLQGLTKLSSPCECELKSVDGKNEDLHMDPRELKKMLKYVMQEAIKEDKKNGQKPQPPENSKFCRLFQSWPPVNDSLCKVMDLNILIDNLNSEEPYLSTGQFYLDLKWIYHNCCILYGSDCEISETALKLEKNFKLELTDVEACTECYYNKYSDNYLHAAFFTKVCSDPHPIVWAKLRGSPFWPAKCLKLYNGHADVRFFGTHDKANVLSKNCIKISREHAFSRRPKYQDAIRELSIYVSNYESVIGPFEYYAKNTPLENSKASSKKSHRRGRHKASNVEEVSRDENFSAIQDSCDSETTIIGSDVAEEACNLILKPSYYPDDTVESKASLQKSFVNNSSNQNMTEVDVSSNVVCHMTFTADEHNGPASDLNNPDEFMDSTTSEPTLPQESLSPNLSLSSLNETPSLFSTTSVLNKEFVSSTKANEHSVDFLNALPVITSAVSANKVSLDSLPIITSAVSSSEIPPNIVSPDLNTSNSFPVITSTISACENADYASKNLSVPDESIEMSVNDTQTDSLSLPFLNNEQCTNLINEAGMRYILEQEDDSDEEVQFVSEGRKKTSALSKNPSVLKALAEMLIGNKPRIKEKFAALQAFSLQTFLSLWIDMNNARFENRDIKMFVEVCNKFMSENSRLRKAELEAEKKIKELKDEIERMKVNASQKNTLKDTIIQKALQKIENRDGKKEVDSFEKEKLKELEEKVKQHETSEHHLIQENGSLSIELEEMKHKLEIRENELDTLREKVNEYEEILNDMNTRAKNVCERAVQTEGTQHDSFDREIYDSDSIHNINQNQDTSQVIMNNQENPFEASDSQQPQDYSQTNLKQNLYLIKCQNSSMSSVPTNTSFATGVVQQVYEQNLLMSSSHGVITTASSSTSMQVPVVLPAIPPPGPIFLDSETSSTFLNSMNSSKSLDAFTNQSNTTGKRKKKFL